MKGSESKVKMVCQQEVQSFYQTFFWVMKLPYFFYLPLFNMRVELPGVEPGSKQGTKLLSTCLAFDYLSGISWPKATYLLLIFLASP